MSSAPITRSWALLVGSAAFVVALATPNLLRAEATLVWLPEMVSDLSADGSFATGSFTGTAGIFRWSEAGGFEDLGLFPGSTNTQAHGISDDGRVIVGHARIDGLSRGFRWIEGEGFSLLPVGPPAGAKSVFAYDVSGDGLTVATVAGMSAELELDGVVYKFYTGSGAARWTEAFGYEYLGALSTSGNASVFGISADGSAATGGSWNDVELRDEAYRWTEAGGMQALGLVDPSHKSTAAHAISADGSTVVGGDTIWAVNNSRETEAFRWTEAEGMIGLGDLPGGDRQGTAFDVSGDGSFVVGRGSVGFVQGYPDYHAFVWDSQNGMRRVQDMLEQDYGLEFIGFKLIRARAISADGYTIAGNGASLNLERGWIAMLPRPEPAPQRSVKKRRCGGTGFGIVLWLPLLAWFKQRRQRRA